MADNSNDIRSPLQACESQGPQNFPRFPDLPLEIREQIWRLSAAVARSIRVSPGSIRVSPRSIRVSPRKAKLRGDEISAVHIEWFYEGTDRIGALLASKESRRIVLPNYSKRPLRDGRTYYFDCDAVVFTGLATAVMMLARLGLRPNEIRNHLGNSCKLEASHFPNASTSDEWSVT